ncbi:hypothetical protein WDV93_08110 [Pantoea ananatis]
MDELKADVRRTQNGRCRSSRPMSAYSKTDVAELKTDVSVLKTDVGSLKNDMRWVQRLLMLISDHHVAYGDH